MGDLEIGKPSNEWLIDEITDHTHMVEEEALELKAISIGEERVKIRGGVRNCQKLISKNTKS